MHRKRTTIIASMAAVGLLSCALAARGDDTEVKGMIMSRTGETLLINGDSGKVTVVLNAATRTKDDTGLFGLGTEEMADTVLITGLKVKVDGEAGSDGRIVAKTITIDGDDLETSEMIQAGLHPTAEQVAENLETLQQHHKRISANQQGVEANKQDITANKQGIATNGSVTHCNAPRDTTRLTSKT